MNTVSIWFSKEQIEGEDTNTIETQYKSEEIREGKVSQKTGYLRRDLKNEYVRPGRALHDSINLLLKSIYCPVGIAQGLSIDL